MRYLVFAFVALLALPVMTQDYDKGLAAYKRGDYATPAGLFSWFHTASPTNDPLRSVCLTSDSRLSRCTA